MLEQSKENRESATNIQWTMLRQTIGSAYNAEANCWLPQHGCGKLLVHSTMLRQSLCWFCYESKIVEINSGADSFEGLCFYEGAYYWSGWYCHAEGQRWELAGSTRIAGGREVSRRQSLLILQSSINPPKSMNQSIGSIQSLILESIIPDSLSLPAMIPQ